MASAHACLRRSRRAAAAPWGVVHSPSRCHAAFCCPQAPPRPYPTPSCDACPAPVTVARPRAPPCSGARRRSCRAARGAGEGVEARRGRQRGRAAGHSQVVGDDLVTRSQQTRAGCAFHRPDASAARVLPVIAAQLTHRCLLSARYADADSRGRLGRQWWALGPSAHRPVGRQGPRAS